MRGENLLSSTPPQWILAFAGLPRVTPGITPSPARELERNWECGVKSLTDEKKNVVANHNVV